LVWIVLKKKKKKDNIDNLKNYFVLIYLHFN